MYERSQAELLYLSPLLLRLLGLLAGTFSKDELLLLVLLLGVRSRSIVGPLTFLTLDLPLELLEAMMVEALPLPSGRDLVTTGESEPAGSLTNTSAIVAWWPVVTSRA